MKKQSKNQERVLTIEQVTELFRIKSLAAKDLKTEVDKYKKLILQHVAENPDGWNGNGYALPNDLRVEERITTKANWDTEELTVEWLNTAIDLGLGDALEVEILHKQLPEKLNKRQVAHLKKAALVITESEILAVCL